MRRNKTRDRDLPTRLYAKQDGRTNESYRYVYRENGETKTLSLGQDRAKAIEQAKRLNDLSRKERLRALGVARNASAEIHDLVFADWENKCAYCGSTTDLGIDHVIPHVAGGGLVGAL